MITEMKVERWRQRWQEASADPGWVAHNQAVDTRRKKVRAEAGALLGRYLAGAVTTQDLQVTYDRRTRTDWEGFGLKGLSGAMFLNKLVKYLGDEAGLADALKAVLRVPTTEEEGRGRMRGFLEHLGRQITAGRATKAQLQPARVPFFVSSWWHLQDTERWPIFHPSGRKALEMDGVYAPSADLVQDYFAFRDCFQTLATALGLTSWDLDHLLFRSDAADQGEIGGDGVPAGDDGGVVTERAEAEAEAEDEGAPEAGPGHARVQWLIATIGRRLGCQVWVTETGVTAFPGLATRMRGTATCTRCRAERRS